MVAAAVILHMEDGDEEEEDEKKALNEHNSLTRRRHSGKKKKFSLLELKMKSFYPFSLSLFPASDCSKIKIKWKYGFIAVFPLLFFHLKQ